jgi:hypothetical protein
MVRCVIRSVILHAVQMRLFRESRLRILISPDRRDYLSS